MIMFIYVSVFFFFFVNNHALLCNKKDEIELITVNNVTFYTATEEGR